MRNQAENRLEVFARSVHRPGKIHDQCRAASGRLRAREGRHRRFLQRAAAHQLAESWDEALADAHRRFRCDIARRDPRAPGRHHQTRAVAGPVLDCRGDGIAIIGNDDHSIDLETVFLEDFPDRGTGAIFAMAAGNTVGTGDDSCLDHERVLYGCRVSKLPSCLLGNQATRQLGNSAT